MVTLFFGVNYLKYKINFGNHKFLKFGYHTMEEKKIEAKLVRSVKNMEGIAPKWVSPGYNGVPDRIVLLPHGKIAFVELKATGKKPRALQVKRHEELRALGFKVYVVDSYEGVAEVLNEIQAS